LGHGDGRGCLDALGRSGAAGRPSRPGHRWHSLN
jgi:hypothetical protein